MELSEAINELDLGVKSLRSKLKKAGSRDLKSELRLTIFHLNEQIRYLKRSQEAALE